MLHHSLVLVKTLDGFSPTIVRRQLARGAFAPVPAAAPDSFFCCGLFVVVVPVDEGSSGYVLAWVRQVQFGLPDLVLFVQLVGYVYESLRLLRSHLLMFTNRLLTLL